MLRPAMGTKSPLDRLAEEQELARLAHKIDKQEEDAPQEQ